MHCKVLGTDGNLDHRVVEAIVSQPAEKANDLDAVWPSIEPPGDVSLLSHILSRMDDQASNLHVRPATHGDGWLVQISTALHGKDHRLSNTSRLSSAAYHISLLAFYLPLEGFCHQYISFLKLHQASLCIRHAL